MKELLEDNVQTMETKTIASSVETRKKPSQNADLKNIGLIDESQTHLKPSVVDTSLIKGQITQVCWKESKNIRIFFFRTISENIVL